MLLDEWLLLLFDEGPLLLLELEELLFPTMGALLSFVTVFFSLAPLWMSERRALRSATAAGLTVLVELNNPPPGGGGGAGGGGGGMMTPN